MATVVEQAAQPDGFCQVINCIQLAEGQVYLLAELSLAQIGVNHCTEHPAAHMHDANAVEKTGMGGPRENQAQYVVLTDIAQSLEQRVVNYLYLMAI